MKNSDNFILRISIALLITFLGLFVILIPNLNNVLSWIGEGILVGWIIVITFFIVTFNNFNKQKKGS